MEDVSFMEGMISGSSELLDLSALSLRRGDPSWSKKFSWFNSASRDWSSFSVWDIFCCSS